MSSSLPSSGRFEVKEGDEHGRKKIKISRITSQKSRQVTFNKRKVGLMKKAMELSILCDCDIAIILFDHQKQLYQYNTKNTTNGMEQIIQRWKEYDGNYEALTNADLNSLKPGRAASFRVGKKRKANSGKASKVSKEEEDPGTEEDEDDEDEDGSQNAPDATETRTSYKHTTTHPLISPHPATAMDYSLAIMKPTPHATLTNQLNTPTLTNSVHPLLTPLPMANHSFSAMLSPASIPSANSLGGGGFGSTYPFAATNPSSTLQQVLNTQASLLSPSGSATNGASSLFGPTGNGMSPGQFQQLQQQYQQHQLQQQQVAAGAAIATRLVEQQQQQQQQQQLVAALSQQQQQQPQFDLAGGIMAKMMQQQSPYGQMNGMGGMNGLNGMNRSPTVASSAALAAALVSNQGSMLSPAGIPPSPGTLFNPPLQSPNIYAANPYGAFLSQQTAQLNMLQQQQFQYQQQPQQMPHPFSLVAAGMSAAIPSALSTLNQAPLNPTLSTTEGAMDLSSAAAAGTSSALTIHVNGTSAAATKAPLTNSTTATSSTAAASSLSPPNTASSTSSSTNGLVGPAATSSSSSSSLLSKRAPFKAMLSLEIPTKSNVPVDITNASIQPSIMAASAPTQPSIQQQEASNQIREISPNHTEQPQQQQQSSIQPSTHERQSSSSSSSSMTISEMKQDSSASPTTSTSLMVPVQASTSSSNSSNSQTIPVSAPAHQSEGSSSMNLNHPSHHQHPMSAYNHNMPMGYSPLTSPSTFMSSDQHAQASMLFSVNSSMSGMAVTGSPTSGPASSSLSGSNSTSSLHPSSHLNQGSMSLHLQPPISPYGVWTNSFSSAMEGGPKIYSPTALRSPALNHISYSRAFQ